LRLTGLPEFRIFGAVFKQIRDVLSFIGRKERRDFRCAGKAAYRTGGGGTAASSRRRIRARGHKPPHPAAGNGTHLRANPHGRIYGQEAYERKVIPLMLLRIYPKNPNPKEIDKAVKVLRDGGLVIYPTDTLYAIGCDALNVRAVEKICRIKGVNPQKSNLSIVCSDLSSVSEYAKINNAAFKLMKPRLPGPFTFILPAGGELPKIYRSRREIGIRIPDHPIAGELVRNMGNPILTMSVHHDGEEPEYTADPELIHEKYEHLVDLVIDGGYGGTEGSTVVDCTSDEWVIRRQGKGILNP
jgi:tRNA threonylcarbamoyl adenosine modification protein (Sua5/YciO/YrdC/YwlC family)